MNNIYADVYTLDTTYAIQVLDYRDSAWHHYSPAEYVSEAVARTIASQFYGGKVKTRLIRIERHIIEDEPTQVGVEVHEVGTAVDGFEA